MNHEELHDELMRDDAYAREWKRQEASRKAGDLLVDIRVRHKLTQAELAEKAGLKRSYIARIEAGNANPTVGSLLKIVKGVGESLDLTPVLSQPCEAEKADRASIDIESKLDREVTVSSLPVPKFWQGRRISSLESQPVASIARVSVKAPSGESARTETFRTWGESQDA